MSFDEQPDNERDWQDWAVRRIGKLESQVAALTAEATELRKCVEAAFDGLLHAKTRGVLCSHPAGIVCPVRVGLDACDDTIAALPAPQEKPHD